MKARTQEPARRGPTLAARSRATVTGRLTTGATGAVIALVVVIAAQAAPASGHSSDRYSVVDLGTLGGTVSEGAGISHPGVISGFASTAAGVTDAVLFRDGQIVDLGTLGGTSAVAIDVNPRGQAVGLSTNAAGVTRGFLWEDEIGRAHV